MKPLNLKETALKEEMKERCLTKGQYIDENAKAKFEMLCHLEDFEVQYWELQQENKQLKEENQELKSQLKGTTHCFDEEEHEKLKKQQKEFIKYLEDGIKQYTPSLRWKHYNEDGFNDYDVENPSCIEVQPIDKIFKEILQKYRSIIGDDKK